MNIDIKVGYDPETTIQDLEKDVKTISQLLEKMTTKKQETELDKFINKMGKVSSDLFSTKQAKAFLDNVIRVRTEFEETEFSLKGLLGSTEKVSQFMENMKDYSFENAFSFKELTNQSVQLLKFQHEADNIIPVIDKLSKVAVGANESLGTFVTLYNQTKGTNLVGDDEIQKWASYGVDIIQELSFMFNKTEKEIRAMVDTGSIGFSELDQVLTSITSSGGKYGAVMSDRIDSLGQDIRLLGEAMNHMYNEVGKKHEDLIRGGIESTRWLINNYEQIGGVIASIVAGYGAYKAALIGVTLAQRAQNLAGHVGVVISLTGAVKNAKQAQDLLNLAIGANPYIKLAAVLMAVGTAIWTFAKNSKNSVREVGELESAINEESRRVNELVLKLTSVNAKEEERGRIINELNSIHPGLVKDIDAEAIAYENLKDNLSEYNDELIKRKAIAAKEDLVVNAQSQYGDLKLQEINQEAEVMRLINEFRSNFDSLNIKQLPTLKSSPLWNWQKLTEEEKESFKKAIDEIIASNSDTWFKASNIIHLFPDNTRADRKTEQAFKGMNLAGLSEAQSKLYAIQKKVKEAEENVHSAEGEVQNFVEILNGLYKAPSTNAVTTGEENADADAEAEKFKNYVEQREAAVQKLQKINQELEQLEANTNENVVENFVEKKKELLREQQQAKQELSLFDKDVVVVQQITNTTPPIDYEAKIKQETLERIRSEKDMEFAIRQARINLIKDGATKILEQNQLDYEQEMELLRRQQEDRLLKIQGWEKTIWESQGGKGDFTPTTTSLPDNEKELFDLYEEQALEKFKNSTNTTLNQILGQYQSFVARRQQIKNKFDQELLVLNTQSTSGRMRTVGEDMNQKFGNGSADLAARPLIEAAELAKKGWSEVGEEMQSLFSSQYEVADAEGNSSQILVSPILPNGSILSPDELNDYVSKILDGSEEILESDYLGVVLSVGVDPEGKAKAGLDELMAQYNEFRTIVESSGGNDQQVEEARILLEAKREEELSAIDSEIASQEASFNVWAEKLTNLGLKQLKDALSTAQATLDGQGGNLSEKEKAVLRAKIKSLEKQIQTVEAKDNSTTSSEKSIKRWKETAKVMTEVQGVIKNIVSSFDGLDDTTKAALTSASNIAGGVVGMITQIQMLAVTGTEAVKGMERASVILAIIGAAVQIMGALFSSKAEKEHQKSLKEIAQVKVNAQREYNKLLREEALLMKEAESIFGTQKILKAANAIKVYRDNLEGLSLEMNGIKEPELPEMTKWDMVLGGENSPIYQLKMDQYHADLERYKQGVLALSKVTVKTGSYTTGTLFWKKQHDIYSSVLDVYDDLIDSEGKLNIARAKSIVATEQMSDENKELLQTLIELQEAADNALDELRSYLQDTFGSLGDGLVDSIVDAIQNDGVDAWEKFGEVGASVLEDLGKQLAYSLFFAEKFKKLQAQLEGIYGSGMSEKAIGEAALKTVGDFYNTIGNDIGKAQEFMLEWQKKAEESGFDLWATSREGSSQGIASISQDSADEMNGRMTAIQSHTYTISEAMKPESNDEMNARLVHIQSSSYSMNENLRMNFELLTVYSQSALQHLAGIESNTFRLGKIESDIGSVKAELQVINMKGIIIRTP